MVTTQFDGDAITFFKPEGVQFGDGKREIGGCIDSGNMNDVAMILLGSKLGIVLNQEGVLTLEHLKHATRGYEYVDIPNVAIKGQNLTLRVFNDPEYGVTAADSNGNPL